MLVNSCIKQTYWYISTQWTPDLDSRLICSTPRSRTKLRLSRPRLMGPQAEKKPKDAVVQKNVDNRQSLFVHKWVYNMTKEKLLRLHTVQHHQTSLLVIAAPNTDWEASYCLFIWPHQQTTMVAENALLGSGDGRQRDNCMAIMPQQFLHVATYIFSPSVWIWQMKVGHLFKVVHEQWSEVH